MKRGALAIFVKTPGLSPIKTRVAHSLGEEKANTFYHLSVQATKSMAAAAVRHTEGIVPHWVVAEEDGLKDPRWADFSTLWQGNGQLGDRLALVYTALKKNFDYVLFIGADCPQMSSDFIVEGAQHLCDAPNDFVLGETTDGGFYLFGGAVELSKEIWLAVPYSTAQTASLLKKQLRSIGEIKSLPELFDIDTKEDLCRLGELDPNSAFLTLAQKQVLAWARDAMLHYSDIE